ncbi:MAG: uroporphyrinogen-III synthase [Gammaproteobacteria bacterium]|nr:uroporphyrinogen-III synthase [Gammaproteobacteria bacterium]MCP5136340.1 uroporphyrinogen-III synthase [Gammaproteobacteria bacterium]
MQPLEGLKVLVTRPAHQAGGLCARIEAEGGTPVRFPTIGIELPQDIRPARERLGRDHWDRVIFVSVNAVQAALELDNRWQTQPLVAVGNATRNALIAAGLSVSLSPDDGFNSEALLALPALQSVHGQSILIVRGEGGRETLAETLRERGAVVEYAEVYRRVIPEADPHALLQSWANGGVDIVTVTSNESLTNLVTMLGSAGHELLARTPLVGVSDRVLQIAASFGLPKPPIVAASAHDTDVLAALIAWRRSSGHKEALSHD